MNTNLNNDNNKSISLAEQLASQVAKDYFSVESLKSRFSDSLDFKDIHVSSLEKALIKMFEHGQQIFYK